MTLKFYSNLISKSKFSEIFGFGVNTPGQQAQKYNRLLSQGLSDFFFVENYSFPPITKANFNAKKVALGEEKNEGLNYHYFTVFNVPILRNLSAFFASKKSVKGADFVVCDLLSATISRGALSGARANKVKTLGIVTDIPDLLPGKAGSKAFKKAFNRNINLCDGLILLTSDMSFYLKVNNKPLCIVEGISDTYIDCGDVQISAVEKNRQNDVQNPFKLLYAGGLEENYGVLDLVKSVINLQNCKLIIYGNGSLNSEIEEYSTSFPDIIEYRGVASNETVVLEEKNVDLLVNPRNSSGEFTRYSFPSKNMEYMSSGTPLLAYKLPGIPDEYDEFYYHISGNIESDIKKIISIDSVELAKFGLKAKEFVTKNKNSHKQAEKVYNLLKQL